LVFTEWQLSTDLVLRRPEGASKDVGSLRHNRDSSAQRRGWTDAPPSACT
jgi:hypothetical protein